MVWARTRLEAIAQIATAREGEYETIDVENLHDDEEHLYLPEDGMMHGWAVAGIREVDEATFQAYR